MIYTEHARTIQLEGLGDAGGDDSLWGEKGSTRATDAGITGWVTATGWQGERLLKPLAIPSAKRAETIPSAELQGRLADLSSTLEGVCNWVNFTTAGALAAAPAAASSGEGSG